MFSCYMVCVRRANQVQANGYTWVLEAICKGSQLLEKENHLHSNWNIQTFFPLRVANGEEGANISKLELFPLQVYPFHLSARLMCWWRNDTRCQEGLVHVSIQDNVHKYFYFSTKCCIFSFKIILHSPIKSSFFFNQKVLIFLCLQQKYIFCVLIRSISPWHL